jgi:prepilin-type N-terminal cleavage/methylation domain-containing protein
MERSESKTAKAEAARNGFTLIEIMIVLAIVVGVLAIGANKLFSSSAQMRTAVRKIAVMTRDIRNNSRLYNVTTRLVISINNEKGHKYWVESAPGNVLLMTDDQRKELDSLTDIRKAEMEKANKFDVEKRVQPKPVDLPKGLFFESVEYGNREKAIVEGPAYIHFFSQGLAEEAAIHLTNRKTLNWTIAINPLTGRADVYERKISLKELRQQ